MATIADALKVISALSKEDFDKLMVDLLARVSSSKSLEKFTEENRFCNGRVCPHCGSVAVVRNGHRADGKQKYRCKDCKSVFVINSVSITSGTRKDFSVWEKFIDCMMNGFPLRKTASICEIHKNTAFIWRHKVLDALQNMHKSVVLDGIVEADETFFPISYKGNHKHSKTFTMPRQAHKRGAAHEYEEIDLDGQKTYVKKKNKRGLSDEKVCVPCAVNRNGQSVAMVGKLGKVSYDCINAAFDNRIKTNSTLCTDKERSYSKFSKNHSLELYQLDTDRSKKGIYNIQHINNYHKRLKDFINRFYGVSTKYLNNYLVWNNLVIFAKETYEEKAKIFLTYVLTTIKQVRCRDIANRSVLPVLV